MSLCYRLICMSLGYEIANGIMIMKVDVMTTDRETIWYESLYVKLYWFGCIAMICGPVQDFRW
jgi:hypothetical protein